MDRVRFWFGREIKFDVRNLWALVTQYMSLHEFMLLYKYYGRKI